MYRLVCFLGAIYTYILKRKFHHFGAGSMVKPILNSSHEEHISIGKNVNIGPFCRITVSTEFGGVRCQSTNEVRIKIGDNVDIGNNSFISANNNIEIGNNVMMGSYVFISDHEHQFGDETKNLRDQPLTEGGHVRIGDNVFIGVKASILRNVTIGERAVISANSLVVRDVPPYCIVAGNPARVISTTRQIPASEAVPKNPQKAGDPA